MLERRRAREIALEVLYGREITGRSLEALAARRFPEAEPGATADFCRLLLDGINNHQRAIDRLIDSHAQNWILERLALIDRNILRMAVYEMIYEPTIPVSVSINEAIELSKEYGGAESGKFVNGVLGQLAVELEKADAKSSAGEKEAK